MSQLLLAQINTILSVIYATDIQVCLPRSETLCTFQLAFYAATTWITASIKTLFVVGLMVCWFTWSWGKRRINGWIHSRWQRFWKFVKAFTDLIYFLWGPISQVGPFIYCFAICFFLFVISGVIIFCKLTVHVFKIWLRRIRVYRLLLLGISMLKFINVFFWLPMKRTRSKNTHLPSQLSKRKSCF